MSDPYTPINLEGEYAFGYTKISGEWTRDLFETPTGNREAHGATLQIKRWNVPTVDNQVGVSIVSARRWW